MQNLISMTSLSVTSIIKHGDIANINVPEEKLFESEWPKLIARDVRKTKIRLGFGF